MATYISPYSEHTYPAKHGVLYFTLLLRVNKLCYSVTILHCFCLPLYLLTEDGSIDDFN